MPTITAKLDTIGIAALTGKPRRAASKAGSTALRDMRSEAVKRIRARKAIRPKYIARAISLVRPRGSALEWAVRIASTPVPLIAYPHKQTKRGVTVEVNRGKRTLVPGSFVARIQSGHVGVFRRRGAARLPIQELRGSRPVDALLHEGEAQGVAERGRKSFASTFARLLAMG